MKKNFNVIEIRGTKGIILAVFIATCLAAGFIVFPGWICMHIWNYLVSITESLPAIGLFQGVLLWGIAVAAYFAFRKDKVVVCFRTPKGLSEDEIKAVYEDMRKQAKEDPLLQAMLKAREAELKYKAQQEQEYQAKEQAENTDTTKV